MANHPNRGLPPLARALKRYRGAETAEATANRLGVPLSHWRDWEQRARSPRTNLASASAAIIDELLDDLERAGVTR